MRGTAEERFEAKLIPEPNSGCHLWTAVRDLIDVSYAPLAAKFRSAAK